MDSYWEANIDLTRVAPELNLYDPDWPILTANQPRAPAKFVFSDPDRRGVAFDSLVSSGCIVSGGVVQRSLLSTNVRVHSYADIQDSVLLPDVHVGRHAILRRVIVDKLCVIPPGMRIGVDVEEDRDRFFVSPGGVVVATPEMLAGLPRPGVGVGH